jgi:phage shock protein A
LRNKIDKLKEEKMMLEKKIEDIRYEIWKIQRSFEKIDVGNDVRNDIKQYFNNLRSNNSWAEKSKNPN